MQVYISERQIGRRATVGSTQENRLIIEDSYHRLLALLSTHFESQMFLLGDRPGRGDFGLFGRLHQLVSQSSPLRRSWFSWSLCLISAI